MEIYMSRNSEEIKSTLSRVANDKTALDMMLELERTLDNANVFAYKNWINGELVEGPDISKYWFKTTWMWPYKMMPDPDGALRLVKYGCKVNYRKDILQVPRRVTAPEDWEDPMTKLAKKSRVKVWLVEIDMPRKFIDEKIDAAVEMANDDDVDTDDIDQAYDDSMVDMGDMEPAMDDEAMTGETDNLGGEEEF